MVFQVKRRAAMYCRLSKDREGNMLGIARQEEDCRKLAARKGWVITETFIDDDVSAYVPGMRPSYEAMLVAIKNRVVNAVVVYDEDRLVRHPFELEGFFVLCASVGLTHLASVSGESDLSNFDHQLNLRIKGAVAKKSSDDASRRYTRMHQQIAEMGRWSGGPRPYGYERVPRILDPPSRDGRLVVVPHEAKIIQEAAERVQAGETLYSICTDLTTRGVPTARGATWRPPTLKGILTGPTHAGKRPYHGEVLREADWPPILDEATHRRLRLLLLNKDRSGERRARVFLLSGVVGRCGLCGAKLVGQRRETGVRTYVCLGGAGGTGCGSLACVAEPLEALVFEALMIRLDTAALARTLATVGGPARGEDDPADELGAAEAKLAELADMWANDEISRAEWTRVRKPVESRRDAAQRRLDSAVRRTASSHWKGKSGALRAAWPTMNLDQRRAVLAAVIEQVIVNPTAVRGRFDPDRVDVVWRA
jgi:DNA invertase Pin-like site-specific DNA recombinase